MIEREIWYGIKRRCYNKNCKDYKNYGAVGIVMDEDFKDDFEKFLNEIGKIPNDDEQWSVDRIDNSLGIC